jgi:MFS family permease
MMVARNVDIALMGIVFATMPLVMQFGRMFFATASDFWGRKLFFISTGFLGTISGLVYYVAHTPLEFLFGKIVEGTKEGSLWAVNRPFLLEQKGGHWRILVYLRTVVYVAYALGSLLAGFFIVWLLFEGTMLLTALFGVFILVLALFIATEKKTQFSMEKALKFLDVRKKTRTFKMFIALFFVMGVSFGFVGGFVLPVFLDEVGFNAETIGLIFGMHILIAGLFSYLFSKSVKTRQLILFAGVLFSLTFFALGFVSSMIAAALVIFFGVVEGIASIGQEAILTKICDKESYGTDIGLLMTGLHLGESLSLALSGFLIEAWGFAAPFLLAASTYVLFYVGSFMILKE